MAQGSRHKRFDLFAEAGNLIAATVFSRGWKPGAAISAKMVSTIQRELHLQGKSRLFEDLIRCPGTREDWLQAVGAGEV